MFTGSSVVLFGCRACRGCGSQGITVFHTLAPADGSTPSTTQEAMIQYSRRQPDGTVCDPDS
ncbi:hypothetical protein ACFXEL_24490 [Streptomyces sp. NPDC059382]|uniref:hypothetical protein n=1 Tax=Streptomyces sp. NPDC059382 TaxID=3346816 RepID=UPI003678F39A